VAHVSIRNLEKSFGRGGFKAVEDLNLEIHDGEFLCLLGPSGCGKTTTLRMIAGLENPTAGQIVVGQTMFDSVEEGVFVPSERRELGFVFQNYALWPHMSVARNIEFGLNLRKVSGAESRQTIQRVAEKLGIAGYLSRLPSELSGGQQQRVALARILAVEPEVILLDEPLSNLDAKLRLEMRAELKRIHHDAKATIIFVTHDQWEAMTLATNIAVMNSGHLQQLGSPDDIYERPANRFVAEFVGNLPINIVEFDEPDPDPFDNWMAETLKVHGLANGIVKSAGIRPENIRIARKDDPDARQQAAVGQARLVDVVPTGGSWILELNAGPRQFFAIAGDQPGLEPGELLSFWAEQRHLHVFDANGSRIPVG